MVAEENDGADEVPALVKGMLSPMRMQITGIAIEYSLMQGRFWLPRMRSMTGDALFVFARVPMSIDQRFEYRSVNSDISLPRIDTTKLPCPRRPSGPRRGGTASAMPTARAR